MKAYLYFKRFNYNLNFKEHVVNYSSKTMLSIGLLSCFYGFFIDFCPAVGPSMQPLIDGSGDLLLFERWSLWLPSLLKKTGLSESWCKLKRGDVVIASSNSSNPTKICKRIIALPQDVVVLSNNGDTKQVYVIPMDYVWLQGDNLKNSLDSRHYGPVPISHIIGRVMYRIWPIWKFSTITANSMPSAIKQQLLENSVSGANECAKNIHVLYSTKSLHVT